MLDMFSQLQAMTGCEVTEDETADTPPVDNILAQQLVPLYNPAVTASVTATAKRILNHYKLDHNLRPGQEMILEQLKKGDATRYELSAVFKCPVENLRSGLSNVIFRELATRSAEGIYSITEKGRKWRMGQRAPRFSIK